MGLNDAQEMLDAAKAQSVIDERRIASLERRLAAIRLVIATAARPKPAQGSAPIEVVEVWQLEQVLDAPDDDGAGS